MTLCAWCGEPLTTPYVKYRGEWICIKCQRGRDKEVKKMENWKKSLDKWLTTPPEEKESKCKCSRCGETLYPDDEYYELDDEIMCEDCAREWLEGNKNWVTESMAYD